MRASSMGSLLVLELLGYDLPQPVADSLLHLVHGLHAHAEGRCHRGWPIACEQAFEDPHAPGVVVLTHASHGHPQVVLDPLPLPLRVQRLGAGGWRPGRIEEIYHWLKPIWTRESTRDRVPHG